MRLKTRIAAWVFAIIPFLGFWDYESQYGHFGMFLAMSAGSWLVLCLYRTWEKIVAVVACAFWGLGLQHILIDHWRPFGASLVILIPAWAIVLAAQVVVILTEKSATNRQGKWYD